jgi:hypothetical protein
MEAKNQRLREQVTQLTTQLTQLTSQLTAELNDLRNRIDEDEEADFKTEIVELTRMVEDGWRKPYLTKIKVKVPLTDFKLVDIQKTYENMKGSEFNISRWIDSSVYLLENAFEDYDVYDEDTPIQENDGMICYSLKLTKRKSFWINDHDGKWYEGDMNTAWTPNREPNFIKFVRNQCNIYYDLMVNKECNRYKKSDTPRDDEFMDFIVFQDGDRGSYDPY